MTRQPARSGAPHPPPVGSTTRRWIAGSLLALLMVAATVNGLGLGSEPSPATLLRQFLYLPVILVAYLLGRLQGLPWRAEWLVVITLSLVVLGTAVLTSPDGGVTSGVYAGLGVALPWGVGHAIRQRAWLAAAAIEHAQQVEATRDAYVLLAESSLRDRLVGELHDHVGHDLALMALLAGRLEISTSGEVRDQAATLRQSALDATDRLRRYLGSLDPASMTAQDPEHTSVAAVVERATQAGMLVQLEGDSELPILVRAAVEALTNAARHAPGEVVTIRVDDARLTATNASPGCNSDTASHHNTAFNDNAAFSDNTAFSDTAAFNDTAASIDNADLTDDTGRPARDSGRGLGLLRDRVHASGGVVTAELVDGTWVLDLRLGRRR